MTDVLSSYEAAASLERYLGDPMDPGSALSFKRLMELDEQEAYPAEACESLYEWGFHHYYVPAEYGGRLRTFEEILALVKVVARRDLSVAISDAHTFLGSVPVWITGTDAQKRRLARFIMDRGPACLALTERHHGSDLLACKTRAMPTDDGYVLTGEKWPINKATVARALTVLARTDDEASARSLSLFLVMKDEQRPGAYAHLPKIRTLGIRSCDISGIRFDGCRLPEEARIGPPGSGVELTLKGFHITRTLCAGLSLGAADTALRSTLRFALGRRLYGRSVFDIPHARHTLAAAFSDVLICDAVALAAARGLHVVPDQFSTWSAVVKYFVPVTVEDTIRSLSVVLGARHYFRDAHDWGIFQKVLRDNSLISLFDGSTVINLHAILLRLRLLARMRRKRRARPDPRLQAHLEAIFSLDRPLPPFQPERLDLLGKGHDAVIHGLASTRQRLHALRSDAGVDPEVLEQIIALTGTLIEAVDRLDARVADARIESGHEQPPQLFELAKTYCALHAAASCVHLWAYSRPVPGRFFARGSWLVFSLVRILQTLHLKPPVATVDYAEEVALELHDRHQANRLFSIVPFQLAETSADNVLA